MSEDKKRKKPVLFENSAINERVNKPKTPKTKKINTEKPKEENKKP